MSKATNLMKSAMKTDKTTRKGLTSVRLIRGRYAKCFLNVVSFELYESAMRTFDRTIGSMKPEDQRNYEEMMACK